MRGKFLHKSMVVQIERAFRALGAVVRREHRVATRVLDGFVDLFVTYHSRRIVGEVELTTDRVRWDVAKAGALKADLLLIIMPSGRLARAAQKCVDELKASGKAATLPVLCLTIGAALKQVEETNGFDGDVMVPPALTRAIPDRSITPNQSSTPREK